MNHPAPISLRAELREMLRLAAPMALANLLQMAVYALDVIFVGRLGQGALAASSLGVTLFAMQAWPLMSLTGALAPFVAETLGREDVSGRSDDTDATIRQTVRMALWLGLGTSVAVIAICGMGQPILLALGQPPALAARAGGFLLILRWAMLPMMLGNVLRTYASAMGRPTIATLISGLAVGINAVANYALVFGHFGAPAWGLAGAACASLITAILSLGLYLIAIRADPVLHDRRVFRDLFNPALAQLAELLRIGVPMAVTVVAESGLFSAAAFLMGLIGEAALAGHTVALQVAALAFMVPMGVGQAATIRVGFHLGAKDATGITRAGWLSLAIGVCFSATTASIMLFAPHLVLSAYVDTSAPANAAMMALAVRFLSVAAAFQLADGAQVIAAGALRGLQDTRVPMAIALTGYWVFGLGTSLWLGFRTPLGGLGIWIGLLVGLAVVAAALVLRWARRDKIVAAGMAREDSFALHLTVH